MASMTHTITQSKPRKAPRAYRGIQDKTSGTLTQLDGILYFFSDAGDFSTVEPAHLNFLTVLGEIGLSETQALMGRIYGGAAWIATYRAQEVA